jgi:hypothetical protein
VNPNWSPPLNDTSLKPLRSRNFCEKSVKFAENCKKLSYFVCKVEVPSPDLWIVSDFDKKIEGNRVFSPISKPKISSMPDGGISKLSFGSYFWTFAKFFKVYSLLGYAYCLLAPWRMNSIDLWLREIMILDIKLLIAFCPKAYLSNIVKIFGFCKNLWNLWKLPKFHVFYEKIGFLRRTYGGLQVSMENSRKPRFNPTWKPFLHPTKEYRNFEKFTRRFV